MYYLSEFIGVIAEIFTLHLYLQGTCETQEHHSWQLALGYIVFGAWTMFLSLVPNIPLLRLISCFFGTVLLTIIFFKRHLLQAVYAGITICGLYALTDLIVMAIFSALHIDAPSLMTIGNARIAFIVISHLIFLILIEFLLAVSKRKHTAITLPFLISLAPGWITSIYVTYAYLQVFMEHGTSPSYGLLVSLIALLYLNIMVVLFAEKAKQSADLELEHQLVEHHYAMQEEYYTQLRNEQEETRSMFHDINKHFRAMKALVQEGDNPEATQVLENSENLIQELCSVVDVGNSVISIILNEYLSNMENADIKFDYDVSVPENLGVTAVDLYILMGNSLDNAIEACCSLPADQRYIRLQMRTHRDMLYYHLENPYAPDYLKKPKGKNHGYGLKNIQKCVDKYQGHLSTSRENQIFTLSLRLNGCVLSDSELDH